MDTQAVQHSSEEAHAASVAEIHREALLTRIGAACPAVSDAPAHARTVIHVFEPVRDATGALIDFRLHFDPATAHDAMRGFAGIQMKATGEWAAPGAVFYMLKQVFETREPMRSVTCCVGEGFELQCRQVAVPDGDTVVTTTTIITRHPRG